MIRLLGVPSSQRCRRCGRPLSAARSLELGVGTACARKLGGSCGVCVPGRGRSSYRYELVEADAVLLRDLDQGGRSVTNDAELVVQEVLAEYPGRRIFYIDSLGLVDELEHDGARFTGFAPARNRYPSAGAPANAGAFLS